MKLNAAQLLVVIVLCAMAALMGPIIVTVYAGGGSVDLVTKLHASEQVVSLTNEEIHYMTLVTNSGTLTAPNVVVMNHFPDPTGAIGFPECGNGGLSHWESDSNGLHAVCEIGDLGPGQAVTMSVVSKPTQIGQYVVLAEGSNSSFENNQQDNADSMLLTIISPDETRPDMSIGLTFDSFPNEVGQLITVEQHLANLGPTPASHARMTATFDYPVQGAYISTTWGTCDWFSPINNMQKKSASANFNQLSCDFGGISPWNEVTVTYGMIPQVAGNIVITTKIGTSSPEIWYDNNDGLDWILVYNDVNSADLGVGGDVPIFGQLGVPITFTFQTTDVGAPATSVHLTTGFSGAARSIKSVSAGCNADASDCSYPTVFPGSPVTTTVVITPNATGIITAQVGVTSLDQSDPNMSNNTATVSTHILHVVAETPDLVIEVHAPLTTTIGSVVPVSVTIANLGGGIAHTTTATIVISASISNVNCHGAGFCQTINSSMFDPNSYIIGSFGDVTSADFISITMDVHAPNAVGTVGISASTSTSDPENTSNNKDFKVIGVVPLPLRLYLPLISR